MRISGSIILCVLFIYSYGQFPYVKKLSYPEQLPTQVVYDMLADSKGYIWTATDKGLYKFNGRNFISVPFDNTSSKAVSYLQEDKEGVIWCMNFYNQLFYYQNDTLRRFEVDYNAIKNTSTFTNVIIGSKKIWFHSFNNIYELDKASRKVLKIYDCPVANDLIIASCISDDIFYAFANSGYLFASGGKKRGWNNIQLKNSVLRLIGNQQGAVGLSAGLERMPSFEIRNDKHALLKPLDISADIYIINGVFMNNGQYWLCTQNGAYLWNKETGRTKCYLPNERVSDVVMDYQGNYLISTLDNGIFICSSLDNILHKVYNDPLLDNFTKLQALPSGEIVTGNSQGLLSRIDLNSRKGVKYNTLRVRETEFITYDSTDKVIISNRGVFKPDQKDPVELFDYSKGIDRDRFGNMLIAVFKGALIMNDDYGSRNRVPLISCPLYRKYSKSIIEYDGPHSLMLLRSKRSMAILASHNKEGFWVAYEDGLYQYYYEGRIKILTDGENKPVVGKSMMQLPDSSLVVGTSTKGVMVFQNGKIAKVYNEKNGLSSVNVRKVVREDKYIWVLTDGGLDRIDRISNTVTNYVEEYGLSNIIINDFIIQKDKILFATPTGIVERYNSTGNSSFDIRFPLLKAVSNGTEIANGSALPKNGGDISFHFEALHYLSANALAYQYRLKGIDTIWRGVNNFTSQLTFNRLSPGNYSLEIQAVAGANYKSPVKSFTFVVPRPYWQNGGVLAAGFICILLVAWLSLRKWKKRLIKRQTIKEQLLKSQLVALRAQMNPHFLYNVLNTVQGLVYANRKAEAGALLGNFSDLMRKILQSSDKQLLSLKDEIENLQLYLELEKARFDEGFSYKITMNNMEDISAIYIPSLLLQPFAENAVKHGLMHKRGIKHLDITFQKKAAGIMVTIDDNGIGRQHSMEINRWKKNKSSGFATVALNERMELFNRLYKQKITCVITDKTGDDQKAAGTCIQLLIPDYSFDKGAL